MKLLTPIIRIVDDDKTVSDSLSFFLNLAGLQTRSFQARKIFCAATIRSVWAV